MSRKCLSCGKFFKKITESSYNRKKYCNEMCAFILRSKTREEYLQYRKDKCEMCLYVPSQDEPNTFLLVHHIDENQKNNDIKNLMTLCRPCHYLVHSKNHQENLAINLLKIY